MRRKSEKDGWNSRYGDKRFSGEEGATGANVSPQVTFQSVAIADQAGNYDGSVTVPVGAVASRVKITVTQIFNNVPTLTVGTVAAPDLLVQVADAVDLTTTGVKYVNDCEQFGWTSGSVVRAVIGGAPNQGAGTVEVEFTY